MKNTDIQKIRQLLCNAQVQVGATIEWAKYPEGAEEHGNKALGFLEEALILLLCETCNGTKRKIKFTPGQREFGGDASTSYEIPCPDCQLKEPHPLVIVIT